MESRRNKAISPVIGTVLIISITVAAMGILLGWGYPYIQEMKETSEINAVTTQMGYLNGLLKEVCKEGKNASTVGKITISNGKIHLESEGERVVIIYSLNDSYDFNVTGLADRRSNIINLSSGKEFECYLLAMWLDEGKSEKSGTKTVNSAGTKFIFSSPIFGAVKVDIYNNSSSQVVGRIWIFDLGDIRYELLPYNIVVENGGMITSNSPTGGFLQDVYYWRHGKNLVLRIYQINTKDMVLSGSLTYRFVLKSDGIELLEKRTPVHNFKIQIYGNFKDAWINYFTRNLDFREINDNMISPKSHFKDFNLSITRHICDVSYGGIG